MEKQDHFRILFLADTHLGFDYPLKPRVEKLRRGEDFFANFVKALQPALEGQADAVVHGGDLFFRSRMHDKIVNRAFAHLIKLAERGIPVYIVPGNHERSWIPMTLFDSHDKIYIFDKPRSFTIEKYGLKIRLAGFPFVREKIRSDFLTYLKMTDFEFGQADVRILCMHQAVEGAKVGTQNYTFRRDENVIRAEDVPASLDLVLTGHIHRAQVLTSSLSGKKLGAPVIYPGATERTSFAERLEIKGYFFVDIFPKSKNASGKITHKFVGLPTRPMHVIDVFENELLKENFRILIAQKMESVPKKTHCQVSHPQWKNQ